MDSHKEKKSPMENANIFSLLFFWWMNDTLKVGSKRPLQDDDLFGLQNDFKTEALVEKLEAEWSKKCEASLLNNRRPRLWKAMFGMFSTRKYFLLAGVKSIHSVTNILLPVVVWYFLATLSENSKMEHYSAVKYVVCICLVTMLKGISQHHSFFLAGITGMQLRASVIGLIYKKIITLNRRSLNELVTGQAINMVSNDANHLRDAGWSLLFLVFAPIEILSCGILLWYLIGWQALVGAGFFLVVIIYISVMSKKAGHLREKAAPVTDERLEIMNESIAGIRSVKMNAWEWKFTDKIAKLKKKEMSYIRRRGAIISSFDALYFTNTPIAGFISITSLLLTNNHLTAFQIFTVISALNVIKFSVSVSMGETLHLLADAKVSLDRIQRFLESSLPMVYPENVKKTDNEGKSSPTFNDRHFKERAFNYSKATRLFWSQEDKEMDMENSLTITDDSVPCISLKNVSCNWNETNGLKTLQNITIDIYSKQLIAITGPVGCGKSSLLQAILRELPCHSGEIKCSGSLVYVPQLPWVFSGTVQENITFGKTFDRVMYQRIVEACSLRKDIDQFSKGDLTNIGQRGVSLSGGQRARICLARALYANADIFLLDDPLSAVDVRVAKHLFTKCIRGLLSDKCCLLVTHHHQFLKSADNILVMKQGAVIANGMYNELQDRDVLSRFEFVGKESQRKESSKSINRCTSSRLRRKSTVTSLISQDVPVDLEEGDEERMVGSVTWSLYWQYFRSAYSAVLLLCLLFLVLFVQVVLVSPHWWLSQIAKMPFREQSRPVILGIYGSLVIGALLLSAFVSFLIYHTLLRSSEKLHNKMVTAVMKAPVLFFDTNPVGRILNRFSKDIGCMDNTLPAQFLLAVQLCLFTFGATVLSAVTNYWLIIGITPLILLFFYFGRYYLKTSRELKRLEAIKCSPVYSHISDTVTGLEVIRSSGMEQNFLQELFSYQDQNTSAAMMVTGCSKWLGVRLEILCSLLVTLVAAGAVLITQIPAIAGMSLTYAMETLDAAQFGVQQTSETENLMTSVERVLAYTQLKSEPGYSTMDKSAASWPCKGNVLLENLSLTYVDGGPRVLKEITLAIQEKEKIGVAGRTGSGKSSILAAMFRMPDPDGEVIVDGISLKTMNVQEARKTFSVITQDPVLFAGTLRCNLDPFNKFADGDLWNALEEAQIKQWVCQLPGQLQYKLIESGSNLSVGERQLVCLARVLLEKKKIVILDEATANVDLKTDRLIQEVIRSKFKDTTVITIAHRLDTIIECDRVMVLEQGRVVEFEKPTSLLNKSESYFAALVKSYNSTVD